MPISKSFTEPKFANLVALPEDSKTPFFIAFLSSLDPVTKQAWCPDVRAALPVIEKKFEGAEEVAFVWVGQRPEWRDPKNVYRVNWNVHNVPTLVRFERVDGEVKETGRLVEDEILNAKRLDEFVKIT